MAQKNEPAQKKDDGLTRVNKGLKGVVVGESKLSDVAEGGSLIYRGYAIEDLAENSSFEEVAYLLLQGKLPTRSELDDFTSQIQSHRELPEDVRKAMELFPSGAHPMATLRTAASFLGLYDKDPSDTSKDANLDRAIDLLAKFPTIVANSYRLSQGQEYVSPMKDGKQAENFLYMLRGKEPTEKEIKVIDTTLILYAEHGFNASTYASRVTASTLSDMYSAMTTAIGTLKGPLHGGANEKAMELMLDIGDVANAESYIMNILDENQKKKAAGEPQTRIMGFGHREYKQGDPRARILKKVGKDLLEGTDDYKWWTLGDKVEEIMAREKGLFPNVDFPCAYVYYGLGLPVEIYTPLFAMSRITGWSAEVLEQLEDNLLIRPKSDYVGEAPREYTPIDQR